MELHHFFINANIVKILLLEALRTTILRQSKNLHKNGIDRH